MIRRLRRISLVGVLIGAALAGCAGTLGPPRALESPEVEVVGLALLGATGDSQRFRVDLRVTNPNAVTLPISRVSFSVRLAGAGVMSGRTVEPFTLEPGAAAPVTVEVTTDLVSSISQLLALLQGPRDAIAYDIDGLVTVSRGLRPTFPFSRRGEVPLSMPGAR